MAPEPGTALRLVFQQEERTLLLSYLLQWAVQQPLLVRVALCLLYGPGERLVTKDPFNTR
jgi:hypothetical protein